MALQEILLRKACVLRHRHTRLFDQTAAQQRQMAANLYAWLSTNYTFLRPPSLELASWAEAHEKIARMTLTIKLDRNWSSFQLANSAPPLSVTDSAIAPSARMAGNRWAAS